MPVNPSFILLFSDSGQGDGYGWDCTPIFGWNTEPVEPEDFTYRFDLPSDLVGDIMGTNDYHGGYN